MLNITKCLFFLLISNVALAQQEAGSTDQDKFKAAYGLYQSLLADAKPEYKRQLIEAAHDAWKYGKKVFGPDSKNTALLTQNYGLALLQIKTAENSARAKEIFIEAIPYFENGFGENSEQLMTLYLDLVGLAERFDAGREASMYGDKAFAIARHNYSENSSEYIDILLDYGVTLSEKGLVEKGMKHIRQAYDFYRENLPQKHPKTGYASYLIGRYEFAEGNSESAITFLESALDTFSKPDQPTSRIELSTHSLLVQAYEETNQSEKATPHCLAIGRMTPQSPDQDFQPIHKVAAKYPSKALSRGLKGQVTVEYTVDKNGMVKDPKVVSYSSKIFVENSMEALDSFRYAPRFEDGVPVETPRVQNRFYFEMAD